MPWALPAAASAISTAATTVAANAAATSLTATLTNIATNALINVAISAAMSVLNPVVGQAGRVSEWTLSPDAPIPFAAGRIGVAGAVVYPETFGPEKMYYGFVNVLSGAGPIKSFQTFRGDDEFVTFDGNGKATSSQWANEMWMRTSLGAQPSTALVTPTGLKSGATLPGWTSAHKLSGKAAYMLVLGENSKRTAYPTGEPKPLWVIEGLFCWDPRLDSTYPGGSGSCRLNNPATWVYSENPAIWALKWALGLWEGPTGKGAPQVDYQVGGIGAKLSGIDVAAFVSVANVADANGWTCAAYPTTDDSKAQVLDAFLQAAGAIYTQRAGKISCIHRAAPRSSVVTITAEDTAGPLEIDTAASRINRINTLRPTFWSEEHRWQLTAIDEVTSSTWQTEDGGKRTRPIEYPFVTDKDQTAQLAALQIANTREGIAGKIPLKPHLQKIKPGDAFTITEAGFVLDSLKCLCLSTEYDPTTGIHTVTFVSETDGKYAFAFGQTGTPPPPQVLVPAPDPVAPPASGEWTLTGTTFTDNGGSVPGLVLTGLVDNPCADTVVFEFRVLGVTDWTEAGTADPLTTRKEITGLTPATQYEVAVSYRIGNRISTRLVLGPATAGTMETPPAGAPANVTGTPAITLGTSIAPDGTEVSTLSGSWVAVANASAYDVEIDDGVAPWVESMPTAAIKNFRIATGRTYRYRVKAVNRDGVRSAAWSALSASEAAGGDVTPPGPFTGVGITALARRILLSWTNPADDDYGHMLLMRNTAGTIVGATAIARAEGSTYADTNVAAGQIYYYWGYPYDRTGNSGGLQFLGAATPTFVSTGGGDVAPSDPVLVTSVGTSALVFGQGPGATALANRVLNDRFEGGVRNIAQPDGGQFDTGATIQSGRLQIVLPFGGTNSMIAFEVLIYDYNVGQTVRYIVGGYTYSVGPIWINVSAQYIGPRGFARAVRFGHYLGKAYIWIGEVASAWNYSLVSIKNVQVGYSNAHLAWESGWSVSLNTTADISALVNDTVTTPRAGDQVFGEGLLESPGGVVATRPNFRTDQGVAALVAGQGPLTTLGIPSYANDAAAVAAGRAPGFVYLNTTTGQQQAIPDTGGTGPTAGVKTTIVPFSTSISTSYTQVAVADVSGQVPSRLNVTFERDSGGRVAGSSDAVVGTVRISECDISGTTVSQVVLEESFAFTSTGLGVPGGYTVDVLFPAISKSTVRTGSVRYKVEIKREFGSPDLNLALDATLYIAITPKL